MIEGPRNASTRDLIADVRGRHKGRAGGSWCGRTGHRHAVGIGEYRHGRLRLEPASIHDRNRYGDDAMDRVIGDRAGDAGYYWTAGCYRSRLGHRFAAANSHVDRGTSLFG